MFIRVSGILVMLLCTCVVFSQEEYEALSWGEVSPEDLAMTIYPQDSSAQAVVLADEGYAVVETNESGRYHYALRRHRQVKILQEAAVGKYGDVSIYYYHKDRLDQLRNLKAQTIAPDGTVSEVKSSEMYREEVNEYWSKLTFSFPNVVVGSVLEYRYQLNSRRIVVPEEWAFREAIPVRSSYYQFNCTVPVVYTYLLRGAEFMTRETISDMAEILRMGDTEIHVSGTKFWMKNGTAVIPEPFMTTEEDYYIKVRFQATESMSSMGYTQSYFGSWEETCRELLEFDNVGGAFSKKRQYKKLLEAATTAIEPTEDKAELVYRISRFVTEQIKWSGRRGFRTDITLDEAFERHEADLPEVQYAGLALLREFGIEADPVILSTRDNGAMIRAFPFLDQFNYVVLLAKIDDRLQLLDFSDPLLKPGIVRIDALNNNGFLLKEDNPSWINLAFPVAQDILAWNGEISPEGAVKGEMRSTMSSFSARSERATLKEQSMEECWSKRLPEGSTLAELEALDLDDVRKTLTVKGSFEVPDMGFVNDDYMYFSPTIYSSFVKNPFVREKRDYPIDFPYPFEEKSVYSYTLPAGYVVESLPENVNLTLPNSDAMFQYMARERDGKVSILVLLRVEKTLYPPDQYEALRSIFEAAASKLEEQVVLRKSE